MLIIYCELPPRPNTRIKSTADSVKITAAEKEITVSVLPSKMPCKSRFRPASDPMNTTIGIKNAAVTFHATPGPFDCPSFSYNWLQRSFWPHCEQVLLVFFILEGA